MLTLKRFKTMTDSYGADLLRWPEQERAAAQTLLEECAEARALLADARMLDDALAIASARRSAAHLRNYNEEATLARLRSGVAARIAATGGRSRGWSSPGWVSLATAGSLAVVAGLVIGGLYNPPGASSDALITLLQPTPLDKLGGLM
jgi:hypothetical protein